MYDREITPDMVEGMPSMRWWLYFYRKGMQFAAEQLRTYRKAVSAPEDLRSVLRQYPALAKVFREALEAKGFLLEHQYFMRQYRGDWYRVEPCWYDGKIWHRVFPDNGVFPAEKMRTANRYGGF